MNADGVTTIAVVGLGTMGHGIAEAFALAGFHVRCYDIHPAARAALLGRIRQNLAHMVAGECLDPEQVATVLARLLPCDTETDAVSHPRAAATGTAPEFAHGRRRIAEQRHRDGLHRQFIQPRLAAVADAGKAEQARAPLAGQIGNLRERQLADGEDGTHAGRG